MFDWHLRKPSKKYKKKKTEIMIYYLNVTYTFILQKNKRENLR